MPTDKLDEISYDIQKENVVKQDSMLELTM